MLIVESWNVLPNVCLFYVHHQLLFGTHSDIFKIIRIIFLNCYEQSVEMDFQEPMARVQKVARWTNFHGTQTFFLFLV